MKRSSGFSAYVLLACAFVIFASVLAAKACEGLNKGKQVIPVEATP